VDGLGSALLTVAIAAGAAIVFVELVHLVVTRLGRRSALLSDLSRTAHRPFQVIVTLFAIQQALRSAAGEFPGRAAVLHGLVIGIIAASAWLVAALLLVFEDVALARWRTDVPDNMKARKVKTQIVILRRATVAAVVVIAIGAVLLTFPEVRTVGASVLASAGLISVVAAVAAQSTLANLFAGLQLAFSDAVRIDDVVVVEGEWGKIEELTLTYVAVQIWDDRRLILPTTYFTTKPFQNWTRTGSAVLGTSEVDVDWSVPVESLRAELRAVCEGTELWDGRVCVLQVTDAVGGMIRLRALVSAHDAAALWDLRCLVRERLVAYVWENHRVSLPRFRAELENPQPQRAPQRAQSTAEPEPEAPEAARVFSGGADADERGARFAGPEERGVRPEEPSAGSEERPAGPAEERLAGSEKRLAGPEESVPGPTR
jgi:small-conductance mechanosensitive channel